MPSVFPYAICPVLIRPRWYPATNLQWSSVKRAIRITGCQVLVKSA